MGDLCSVNIGCRTYHNIWKFQVIATIIRTVVLGDTSDRRSNTSIFRFLVLVFATGLRFRFVLGRWLGSTLSMKRSKQSNTALDCLKLFVDKTRCLVMFLVALVSTKIALVLHS